MIKKGNNHSPVQVNLGKYDYNVWVYSSSSMGNDGVIRHHYKTFRQRYSMIHERYVMLISSDERHRLRGVTFFQMDYDTFDTDIFSEINDMSVRFMMAIEYPHWHQNRVL